MRTFYLYDNPLRAYHYLITEEPKSLITHGFPVVQMNNMVDLAQFIGQLVIDGYPSERMDFTSCVNSSEGDSDVYKLNGLDYFVIGAPDKKAAVRCFLKNRIGVTTENIRLFTQTMPEDCHAFNYEGE